MQTTTTHLACGLLIAQCIAMSLSLMRSCLGNQQSYSGSNLLEPRGETHADWLVEQGRKEERNKARKKGRKKEQREGGRKEGREQARTNARKQERMDDQTNACMHEWWASNHEWLASKRKVINDWHTSRRGTHWSFFGSLAFSMTCWKAARVLFRLMLASSMADCRSNT